MIEQAARGVTLSMLRYVLLLVLCVGCAQFDHTDTGDHHFHESAEAFAPKDVYNTVQDVIQGRGCSTGPLKPLDVQIAKELSCLAQSPLGNIEQFPALLLGEGVRPHLQSDAADALKRASNRIGRLVLTSGWRSVAQQHVLKSWEGRCGIRIAATPGRSHHQSGLAIDTGDYRSRSVRNVLREEGFQWYCDVNNQGRLSGCADPVHFVYDTGDDLRDVSVLAFQKLWNRNHPNDRLEEDGFWGPTTANRMNRAPIAGFAQTASCGESQDHDGQVEALNQCEYNEFPASFGYETCGGEEVWRCACSGDLGQTISQVCRNGVWLNHQLAPQDCSRCNDETAEGCRAAGTQDVEAVITAAQVCGDGQLALSESGNACQPSEEAVWRCACSENIGDVVSQVCRDGQWTNYRLSPSDCGGCDGEYGPGCEP